MIIGKLIAGLFGLMLGSALGISLFGLTFGLWVGHQFDEAFRKNVGDWSKLYTQQHHNPRLPQLYQQLFAVLGHIAKSDGSVSRNEIQVANKLMDRLQITQEDQRHLAQNAFNRGKSQKFPLQSALMQIQLGCLLNAQLKEIFIDAVRSMHNTETQSHPHKKRLIDHIILQLRETFQSQQRYQHQYNSAHQPTAPSQDDYRLLDVSHNVSKEDLKKAYRRMMHRHHPDRLSAQGKSEKDIKQATEKTQAIKSAYERICQAKGY